MNISQNALEVKYRPTDNICSKSKLDWALYLASLGFGIFPLHWTDEKGNCSCDELECKSGKHPLLRGGFHGATTDPEEIKAIWDDNPEANYGVYPGERFVVVDLDVKHEKATGINGLKTLANCLGVDEYELYDMTFAVESPSGGVHLYFKSDKPFGDKIGRLDGVDIRASRGYVVGPGSSIGGKLYRVISEAPFAPLPQEIADILSAPIERDAIADVPLCELDLAVNIARAKWGLKHCKPAIEYQNGDDQTYKIAAAMRSLGLAEATANELMLDHYNPRCEPPWPFDQLERKVRNAYRYATGRPGEMYSVTLDEWFERFGRAEHPELFNDSDQSDREPKERNDNPFAKFESAWFSGPASMNLDIDYDFIAEGFIPAQGFTAFLSERGVGKSTVLIDLAGHLVNDMPDWHGVKIDKGWSIVYIVGEDLPGVTMRQRAWRFKHGKDFPEGRWNLLRMPINLSDPEEVRDFAAFVKREIKGRNKIVFILDTWQRMTAFAEGGQSNDESMQVAIANLKTLTDLFNGPSIVAFHPPKANKSTIMGSSTIENSTDSICEITRNGDVRRLENTRLKGDAENSYILFNLERVEYGGTDNLGRTRSGPVLKKIGGGGSSEAAMDRHIEREAERKKYGLEIKAHLEHTTGKAEVSVHTFAERFAGKPMAYGEKGENFPSARTLKGDLPELFIEPLRFEDGSTLTLSEGGKGRGKGATLALDLPNSANNAD